MEAPSTYQRLRASPRAGGAEAVDLDGVPHLGEPVGRGDRLGPALDGVPGDLDRETARAAHDVVVVVCRRTRAVDGFALGGADDVELALGCHKARDHLQPRDGGGAQAALATIDALGKLARMVIVILAVLTAAQSWASCCSARGSS